MERNKEYKYCIRCGRELKTEESRKRGMGDVCYNKYLVSKNKNSLFSINKYLTNEQKHDII